MIQWRQISTKDNTAYSSTHLQVPTATADNPAYVIAKDNGNTILVIRMQSLMQSQYDYVQIR